MSTFVDAYLWPLEHLLQPTSNAHASRGRRDPMLKPSRESMYITYPYREFHKDRVLVSQLAENHPIPVTHKFHMFLHGAISPDC
jgi:hypothetical protein